MTVIDNAFISLVSEISCGLLFRNIAKCCLQNCNKEVVSDSGDRFVLQKSSDV